MERVRMNVYGRVQGVGFRYSTQVKAAQLGLTGYVKNLPNGCVEIVAIGHSEALEQLQAWAEVGPAAAQVQSVEVVAEPTAEALTGFSIRR
ncbi:acylphosphatase [Oscillatoria sp. CS-180]|uniref:acylphosphatase n=1 Tax=Oscillatoria sp. CS-180 TaxID=3021720 RepID=UPI00233116D4|nr:acylphosphatase [Oscillatoria sp. CS-180]MDB9526225.1 acylphosphatase [Oscillatoria sp. CS-180]